MKPVEPPLAKPLRGKTIFLGLETGPESRHSPINAEVLQEAVISLSRAVFSRGGTLVLANSDPLLPLILIVATEYWERDLEADSPVPPSVPSVCLCGPAEEEDLDWWTSTGLLTRQGRDWPRDGVIPLLVETQRPLAMICLGGADDVARQAELFRKYGHGRSIFAVTATGGHAAALARKEIAIAVDDNLMRELGPLRANAKFPEQREPLSEAQQREEAAIIPFPLLMQRLVDRLARAE